MKFVQCDVATYIIGQAASMGSCSASGTKGKRFTLPNARNLMHQPLLSGVMEGQATDIEIEAREMLRIRDRLYTDLRRRDGPAVRADRGAGLRPQQVAGRRRRCSSTASVDREALEVLTCALLRRRGRNAGRHRGRGG
jgi:hypothetical protein